MLEDEADLRSQIWPIVLDMAQAYFPAGTGFGTFDPLFRTGEPDALLNPQYINLAHNDWLQIFLEGGIVGLVLLAGAVLWFVLRSVRAWSSLQGAAGYRFLARAGSIVGASYCKPHRLSSAHANGDGIAGSRCHLAGAKANQKKRVSREGVQACRDPSGPATGQEFSDTGPQTLSGQT